MAEPFVAEIKIFGFNFAPRGWAFCAGQILSISQNTALFSLLGTDFGGDGRANFALPDLRGRVPVQAGQGLGLSPRTLGAAGGEEFVTLTQTQLASHTHPANCTNKIGTSYDPANNVWSTDAGGNQEYGTGHATGQMSANAVQGAGGGTPHNNLQPFLVLNYCIALQGVYPPRS